MIFRRLRTALPDGELERLWTFQPKQSELLDSLEATGEVPTVLGCAGSRGSAKSGGLRGCAVYLATTYPGITVYIVRRVLGDLLENHMEKIKIDFPAIHSFYRQSDYEYALPNGSRIVYVYAESAVDVERVSYGPEGCFLLIDQAEQFTENELMSFRICNRWPNSPKGFPKTCYFFNVGVGVGAEYLRRIFHLRSFQGKERPSDFRFTHVFGWDNYEWFRGQLPISMGAFYELSSPERFQMFIEKTSEGQKMDGLPKHRRDAELLGNFDSFSGQYFSDVWGEHCILTAKECERLIQPWWTRWMAQDWGFGDHDSHGWFVTGKVSPSEWVALFGGSTEWPIDVVIQYRENLVAGRAEMDLANDIVNMTPEAERPYIKDFFLSEDAFGQKGKQSENTVGQMFTDIMRRYRMPEPQPARQDRINGWRFMYSCMRQAGMRGLNIDRNRATQGPAFFVSAECVRSIEKIPLAVRDEKNPEDVMRVAGAVWEDVTDMVRYALFSKLAPRKQAPMEVRLAEAVQGVTDRNEVANRTRHFLANERKKTLVSRGNRW